MARAYRKKPVTVEAIQWTGENHAEMCEFIDPEVFEIKPKEGLIIHTLEGDHHASPGDYIIKGVNGEFYPCKPDIFAKTYEPVTLTLSNEWVSVDERLPEYNPGTGAKSYWVAKKDNAGNWQMKIAQYCDYGYAMTMDAETEVTWRDWDFTKIANVTHWMPLPAPPDKGNNVLAKTPNEPLTIEQLRASPHGKIKDSTLQSICNRANEIACRPPEGEVNA